LNFDPEEKSDADPTMLFRELYSGWLSVGEIMLSFVSPLIRSDESQIVEGTAPWETQLLPPNVTEKIRNDIKEMTL
jgi:hypothetical protein